MEYILFVVLVLMTISNALVYLRIEELDKKLNALDIEMIQKLYKKKDVDQNK